MGFETKVSQNTPCLKINGTSYVYDHLRVAIDKLDLIEWLTGQHSFPKVYWHDKEAHREHAAIGSILCLDTVPLFEEAPHENIRFYGGMAFPSPKQDTLWGDFPRCAFWLPAFEVIQTPKSTELVAHFLNQKASRAHLKHLDFQKKNASGPIEPAHLLQREESISLSQWKNHLASLLVEMKKKEIEKVVLARKTQLHFSYPLSVWQMIQQLKERVQSSTLFAFHLKANAAFIGASPEKLFHRKQEHLYIDAVAGTRKRGTCLAEDRALENDLKSHPKDKKEFNLVKTFIHSTALPFATHCTWLKREQVLKTTHVQHLYNRAHLLLKENISNLELIKALHPTPAVGGFPREEALKLIFKWESFERGWYASPVGWISPSEADLCVAIRSGLILGSALHLFAGAGIVAKSCAEKEWEEIDHKMRLLLYGCGLA